MGSEVQDIPRMIGRRLIEQGREEGRQESRREQQLLLAGKLLAKGTPPEEVTELTELPLEEVLDLMPKLNPMESEAQDISGMTGRRLIELGRKEGHKQGRREQQLLFAGKLLAQGTPPAEVAELTELTLEEVLGLMQ